MVKVDDTVIGLGKFMGIDCADFYDTERYGVVRRGIGYSVVDKQTHDVVFNTKSRLTAHAEARRRNAALRQSKVAES